MAVPYAAIDPRAGWAADGTTRRAWDGKSLPTGYRNVDDGDEVDGVDGGDGVGPHAGSYARQGPGMGMSDGTYPSTGAPSQPQYPRAYYQQSTARYGALRSPSSMTPQVKSEGMAFYGQPTPQYNPQMYPSGEPSGPRLPPGEDQSRPGWRGSEEKGDALRRLLWLMKDAHYHELMMMRMMTAASSVMPCLEQ